MAGSDWAAYIIVERVAGCDVPLPNRGTSGSAGWDMYMPREVHLRPGQLQAIPCGFKFNLPPDKFGDIRPRSSARKMGLDVEGVIDPDYRGEVLISVRNTTGESIKIEKGSRIAQMLILDANLHVGLCEGRVFNDTARGTNGLGSTGT